MITELDPCLWSATDLAASLSWLVRGETAGGGAAWDGSGFNGGSEREFEEVITASASALDVGITAISCGRDRLMQCLIDAAPLIVRVPGVDGALFVAESTSRRVTVIAPDGRHRRIGCDALAKRLLGETDQPADGSLGELARRLGRQGTRIGNALKQEAGTGKPVFIGWTLDAERRETSSKRLLATASLPLLFTHFLQFSFWIASWVALVVMLSSPGERSNLMTVWIVALASALALLPVETALEQGLSGRIGVAVKRWLLADALNADRKYVGALGLGQLIARSLETHHLDAIAARGGIRFALSMFDAALIVVAYAAFFGVDALLMLFAAVVAWGVHRGRAYYAHATTYLRDNLHVTSVHTEHLVGHRTRKAFMPMEDWNLEEDTSMARYHESARRFDDALVRIALIPRVWVVVALFVVLMTLFRNEADAIGAPSVAMVGFVIATFAALQSAVLGAAEAIRAWVSFDHIDTLARDPGADEANAPPRAVAGGGVVCRGLNFSYPGALTPAVGNVDLAIAPGQRVLLTGRSGSGKSTLAAVMAGRLQQDSGIVLSGGVDRHIVGMQHWRKLICYVPQQGANHVLTETFAFNLLLGRPWPPTREDMEDARKVATDLGLDSLIERMPAGMMQMVGEGGWSLSQGEKARLYVARGILQRARLLIADEVLSPLDATTAAQTLDALDRHCDCLMLIAHA